MGFNEFISKLFGNKAKRDMREIQPWVEKIKAAYPAISALSNDELRAASATLKAKIQNTVTEERNKIAELKAIIEETELEKREAIFAQIDKLEKEVLEKLDKALDEALPEAFAIVKDSARRFAENEVVEQRPVANAFVKEGRKIMLVMSSVNKPMVTLPSVTDNCSLREAEARLKASGLVVSGILQQDGEKDWVYSVLCNGKELYNGESIARGSNLVLVVGNGNRPVRKESVIDEDYFE